MNFSFGADRITKKQLKEHRSEEEYMSFYLGIIPDDSLHVNPLRADRNPTASFYRSKSDELIFKDWKTGFHANFIDIVMEKYKLIYPEAIKMIARDFGLLEAVGKKNKPLVEYRGEKVTNKGGSIIQCEIQEYTDAQIKWWKSFGVSVETLKKYNVFAVKSVFINGVYTYGYSPQNPIYGYYFGKDAGRELWKIYFPRKRSYRFLSNTSVLQGARQLPKTGDILVVTKSLKDVMVLYEMGIPAIATQAESVILTLQQYNALKKRFKRIVFNGDWDGAGQLFMIKSRKAYEGICLSFSNKKEYAKDLSDYVKKVGFDEAKALVNLIMHDVNMGRFDYQYRYAA